MWRCHMVGVQDTERGLRGGDDSVSRAVPVTKELLAGLGLTAVYFWVSWGSACCDCSRRVRCVCVGSPRGIVLVLDPFLLLRC